MNVLGIVVEYNPFHNGHLYHLKRSKEISGADHVVAVMSSNYIQRGEPSIINKWSRTKTALLAGVDLVLELPVIYSMASAEFFAYGAIRILDSLGVVDSICFGSENGKIEELSLAADVFLNEPEPYRNLLKNELNKGLSFPSARENALSKFISKEGKTIDNLSHIMGSSNNILGIEYIKALKRLKSRIVPLTIKRIANTYNTEKITGAISSATSIRKHIYSEGNRSDEVLKNVLPDFSYNVLKEEFNLGRGPVFPHNFENVILSFIRTMHTRELKDYPFVSEGLENRIKKAADNSGTLNELIENISTKRYTRTRIQRILFNFLIGVKAFEFSKFNEYGGPQYVRVLGFNSKGRHLLSNINKKGYLQVVVKAANFKNSCNPLFRRMLEVESRATDLYVLGCSNPEFKKAGQEFTQNVIIVE